MERKHVLFPVWQGSVVYEETGMFLGKDDLLPLLFMPEEILSVTSYDGQTVYQEGRDFILTDDGRLALTEQTSIPYITKEAYYHGDPESLLTTVFQGQEVYTY